MLKTYKVFISHSWDHVDDLMSLRRLLESRGYFSVEFEETPPHDPINSSNSDYIKRKIRENIGNSDVVIGVAGIYASHSEWMKWELETAKSLNKPILGVIPWGQINVSAVVSNLADATVRWNTESIVDAIRRLSRS